MSIILEFSAEYYYKGLDEEKRKTLLALLEEVRQHFKHQRGVELAPLRVVYSTILSRDTFIIYQQGSSKHHFQAEEPDFTLQLHDLKRVLLEHFITCT